MKRKVRIKSLPEGYHMMPDGTIMKDGAHKMQSGGPVKNLQSIPREVANLEAEKGEIAVTDLDKTGNTGVYNIGGQRHVNGGTPLNLDPGSFIFSDTRKMKIKDPEFLAKYGKNKPTTPAKLAKRFSDKNDYIAALYNKDADPIQKRTAQAMINNYDERLGEIAFRQEAMKGFPQGVPGIAEDFAQSVGYAAYGGYLPKAQDGTIDPRVLSAFPQFAPQMPVPQVSAGPRPEVRVAVPNPRTNSANRISVYTPEEMAWYEATQGLEGASYTPGMTALTGDKSRPAVQGMRPDRSYGEEDITSAKALADLKARQPWIFEQKPNWDFSNPEDVKWAQKTYEDRRKKYFESQGLSYVPYFKDKSDPSYRPGEAFDAKFGEHTFNMPSLELKGKPTEVTPEPQETKPAEEKIAPEFTPAKPGQTYPFQQDVNNVYTNLLNKLSEEKYLPWAPQLGYNLIDAVYPDDTRQQQQIAGRARGIVEALGAFAGPARQASMASKISGEAGDQAANVAATMGNQIIGIANQAAQYNAQLKGQTDQVNAAFARQRYNDAVKALDIFDEKMRAYRTKGTELYNTLETNRAKAQLLNQLYPDFQINTMPGMYGEIMANPEVLRAMQDPAKYKGMTDAQKAARKESIDEVFTLFPVTFDKDGKDIYAQQRAALLSPLMKGSASAAASNPMADYLKMFSSMFPQQYGVE